MAPVDALVSVEEYLHTVYRPDCDYVDGELVDRNVGEKSHAKAQRKIMLLLLPGASAMEHISYAGNPGSDFADALSCPRYLRVCGSGTR